MRNLFSGCVALLAALALASFPASAAQYEEAEPNNSCATAQFIGTPPDWPAAITGELVPTGAEPPGDVDFFMLQAPAGTRLRALLNGDTNSPSPLNDPYLGLFDSACNLLAQNDDFVGLNSRLDFEVPGDGMFILAATGCCDGNFDGNHGQLGSYRLNVLVPPEPVQAITGRLIDAITNVPLPGNAPPYSFVELARCVLDNCNYLGANAVPDENGVFTFEVNFLGLPLDPGQYIVRASAGDYASVEYGPFAAASGELVDLGDIAMSPPPYVIENVIPCADIPATGGRCNYTVDVRNNTDETVRGLGWSIVNTYGGTSPLGYSVFPADSTRQVQLRRLSTRTMRFSFDVPSDVAPGTIMCADAWFADRATEYFGTLRNQSLFCVFKQSDGFSVIDQKTAAGILGIEKVGNGRALKAPAER